MKRSRKSEAGPEQVWEEVPDEVPELPDQVLDLDVEVLPRRDADMASCGCAAYDAVTWRLSCVRVVARAGWHGSHGHANMLAPYHAGMLKSGHAVVLTCCQVPWFLFLGACRRVGICAMPTYCCECSHDKLKRFTVHTIESSIAWQRHPTCG